MLYMNNNQQWAQSPDFRNKYINVNGVWVPAFIDTYRYGPWSGCNRSCGGGTQTRQRYADGRILNATGEKISYPLELATVPIGNQDVRPCNTHPCCSQASVCRSYKWRRCSLYGFMNTYWKGTGSRTFGGVTCPNRWIEPGRYRLSLQLVFSDYARHSTNYMSCSIRLDNTQGWTSVCSWKSSGNGGFPNISGATTWGLGYCNDSYGTASRKTYTVTLNVTKPVGTFLWQQTFSKSGTWCGCITTLEKYTLTKIG